MANATGAARATFNYTGRIDIGRISYVLGRLDDGKLRYDVKLLGWDRVAAKLSGRRQLTVTLEFSKPGGYGQVERISRPFPEVSLCGGFLTGSIAELGAPDRMGLKVAVTDTRNNFLATGKLSRPDTMTDEILPPVQEARRRPKGQSVGGVAMLGEVVVPKGSLIHYRIDPSVSGNWDVQLTRDRGEAVGMPILLLHPRIGDHLIRTDAAVQALILPEVCRRVLMAMVLHPVYAEEAWFPAWKEFALALTPSVTTRTIMRRDISGATVILIQKRSARPWTWQWRGLPS